MKKTPLECPICKAKMPLDKLAPPGMCFECTTCGASLRIDQGHMYVVKGCSLMAFAVLLWAAGLRGIPLFLVFIGGGVLVLQAAHFLSAAFWHPPLEPCPPQGMTLFPR